MGSARPCASKVVPYASVLWLFPPNPKELYKMMYRERILDERVALALGWSPPGSERSNRCCQRLDRNKWIPPPSKLYANDKWTLRYAHPKRWSISILDCFRDLVPPPPTKIRIERVLLDGTNAWRVSFGNKGEGSTRETLPEAICLEFLKWEPKGR